MAKPLDQFGGWLNFFYVGHLVCIIYLVGASLIYALAIFAVGGGSKAMLVLIGLLHSIITVILCIKIVKILKIKELDTPQKVVKIMTWLVILAVIFAFCNILIYSFNDIPEVEDYSGLDRLARTVFRVIGAIIGYAIWKSYFKKSKRVIAYYGINKES